MKADMDKKVKVTLCMISGGTRPLRLYRCLRSAFKYVDEICLTFTVPEGKARVSYQIAKKFNAKISYVECAKVTYECDGKTYENIDSFADARNFNFDQASNDVIIWLDEDDILVNGEQLPVILHKYFLQPEIGRAMVQYNYERDKNGWLVSFHPRERIVRKGWFTWMGKLHETMIPLRQFITVKIDPDMMVVEHREKGTNCKKKFERNLAVSLRELELQKEDRDPRTVMNVGKTLFGLERWEECIPYFEEVVNTSGWDGDQYSSLRYMARACAQLKAFEAAEMYAFRGIKIMPHVKECYFELARIYYEQDEFAKCIHWTEQGFRAKKDAADNNVRPRDLDYNPLLMLAVALTKEGRLEEAKATYLKLLQFKPDNDQLKFNYNLTCKYLIIKRAAEAFIAASEYCIQNEELAKAEQIFDALPLDVKNRLEVKKQWYRIKNIMNRIRTFDSGERKLSKFIYADVKQDLDKCAKYQALLQLLEKIDPEKKSKILDVGCFNGQITNDLVRRGFSVTGCDIGEEALELAKQDANQAGLNTVFEKCSYKDVGQRYEKQFDIVICFDVLEHVLDPKLLIKGLEKACKGDGQIFINIPNGAWHQGNMDTQLDELYEHVYSYEYQDMARMLAGRHNVQTWVLATESVRSPGQSSLFITYQNRKVTGRLIEIYCCGTPETWTPDKIKTGIGGSEEATINMAQEWLKQGFRVIVYNSCGDQQGWHNDIPYVDRELFDYTADHDIVIGWRDPGLFDMPFKANRRLLWLHDVPNPYAYDQEIINKIDKIIVLSQYHKNLFKGSLVPDDKLYVSSNGVDMSLFNCTTEPRNKYKVVYGSSPDRGLDTLLSIWPEVKEAVPEAELHIYYGWNVFDKCIRPSGKQFKDKVMNLVNTLPGVIWHGRVGQEELAKEYMNAGFWAYPTYFPEISCITAMKVQIAGAIPVCTDYAALAETVKYGFKIKGNINNAGNLDKFKVQLIDALKMPDEKQERIRQSMMITSQKIYAWEFVAQSWAKNLFK